MRGQGFIRRRPPRIARIFLIRPHLAVDSPHMISFFYHQGEARTNGRALASRAYAARSCRAAASAAHERPYPIVRARGRCRLADICLCAAPVHRSGKQVRPRQQRHERDCDADHRLLQVSRRPCGMHQCRKRLQQSCERRVMLCLFGVACLPYGRDVEHASAA